MAFPRVLSYDMEPTRPMASRLKGALPEDEMPAMTINKNHNGLAIAVALVSVVVQFGSWVWWGGRLDQKVERHERYIMEQETLNKASTVQIEVTKTELKSIKEVVDRIERKLDAAP